MAGKMSWALLVYRRKCCYNTFYIEGGKKEGG